MLITILFLILGVVTGITLTISALKKADKGNLKICQGCAFKIYGNSPDEVIDVN